MWSFLCSRLHSFSGCIRVAARVSSSFLFHGRVTFRCMGDRFLFSHAAVDGHSGVSVWAAVNIMYERLCRHVFVSLGFCPEVGLLGHGGTVQPWRSHQMFPTRATPLYGRASGVRGLRLTTSVSFSVTVMLVNVPCCPPCGFDLHSPP